MVTVTGVSPGVAQGAGHSGTMTATRPATGYGAADEKVMVLATDHPRWNRQIQRWRCRSAAARSVSNLWILSLEPAGN
tara:strand:+ start:226 stop:459 length:234 start_codon:yes stop_codon:yes gene_type:complete